MREDAVSSMSEDEFLAYEFASPDRHEFVDGVTRAMTGASIRHNDVAGNLFVALRAAAKGTAFAAVNTRRARRQNFGNQTRRGVRMSVVGLLACDQEAHCVHDDAIVAPSAPH